VFRYAATFENIFPVLGKGCCQYVMNYVKQSSLFSRFATCSPQKYFERPQLFYVHTDKNVKQGFYVF